MTLNRITTRKTIGLVLIWAAIGFGLSALVQLIQSGSRGDGNTIVIVDGHQIPSMVDTTFYWSAVLIGGGITAAIATAIVVGYALCDGQKRQRT